FPPKACPLAASLTLDVVNQSGVQTTQLYYLEQTPGVFAVTSSIGYATIWATGLGPVRTSGPYQMTTLQPLASVNGTPAEILFSGIAPGWLGLYQVNVGIPTGAVYPAMLTFQAGGYAASFNVAAP